MQSVILSDGSFWNIYGTSANGSFSSLGIMYGTASVSGNSASGSYTDIQEESTPKGTYSGTVSAQKSLNLTFNDPSNRNLAVGLNGSTFNMSYDSIYNQPASLSEIAGNYSGVGFDGMTNDSLTISGSSFAITTSYTALVAQAPCTLNGTITPHGTVNVFDVSFTTYNCQTVGGVFFPSVVGSSLYDSITATYKGILFKTSGSLSNYVEIAATDGNGSGFFFMGSK